MLIVPSPRYIVDVVARPVVVSKRSTRLVFVKTSDRRWTPKISAIPGDFRQLSYGRHRNNRRALARDEFVITRIGYGCSVHYYCSRRRTPSRCPPLFTLGRTNDVFCIYNNNSVTKHVRRSSQPSRIERTIADYRT